MSARKTLVVTENGSSVGVYRGNEKQIKAATSMFDFKSDRKDAIWEWEQIAEKCGLTYEGQNNRWEDALHYELL